METGEFRAPVASLKNEKGLFSHFVVEEECYVLYMQNGAGICTRTPWIFKEAFLMLRSLAPPAKLMMEEARLTVKSRDLKYTSPSAPGYAELVEEVRQLLPAAALEELGNICTNGPVWDGDCISKKNKEVLLATGLVTSVISGGEEGFIAATLRGLSVHRAILTPAG